jgi:hypothetical protein
MSELKLRPLKTGKARRTKGHLQKPRVEHPAGLNSWRGKERAERKGEEGTMYRDPTTGEERL